MSFAFWSKNDLPDMRLSGDRQTDEQITGSGRSSLQKHRKLSPDLNTSVKMDVDVDNDLQCPICLELYTYPIILPCSHVLCRAPCAEHLFDFNFIRCPVCRDNCYVSGGISSLPRVIALENIIERYKNEQKKDKSPPSDSAPKKQTNSSQESCSSPSLNNSLASLNSSAAALSNLASSVKVDVDIRCQNCPNGEAKKRAKKFCITCCRHFCATCLRVSHPNKEPFTNHTFTEPCLASSADIQASTGSSSKKSSSGLSRKNVIDSFCQLCTQTFCSRAEEDRKLHEGHVTIALDEAYREFKSQVEDSSSELSNGQARVVTNLKDLKDGLKDLQQMLTRRRDEINMQCDALLAEVENKRNYFLADLDYEERVQQNNLEDTVKNLEKVLGASKGLQGYVREVTAADRPTFVEIANTLNDRLLKANQDCRSASSSALPVDLESLQYKVIDLRREKVFLRDMHYLGPPSTPIVDVSRCSRSEGAVVLALCPPGNGHDLVDQYELHFCSEEQKNIEIEETLLVKNSMEESFSSKPVANSSGILVLLVENLCRASTYYFCLSAANAAGKSASSEVVQCTTLGQDENVIPVPMIIDSLCKRFTSSIQVFCSSPLDVSPEQKISHFLLYRQNNHHRLWRCVSMYGREEHRVFGLEPATGYEFVILAYNLRGECQLSNKVVVDTAASANF